MAESVSRTVHILHSGGEPASQKACSAFSTSRCRTAQESWLVVVWSSLCRVGANQHQESILVSTFAALPSNCERPKQNWLKLRVLKTPFWDTLQEDRVRFRGLGSEDMLVYQIIQASQNMGEPSRCPEHIAMIGLVFLILLQAVARLGAVLVIVVRSVFYICSTGSPELQVKGVWHFLRV